MSYQEPCAKHILAAPCFLNSTIACPRLILRKPLLAKRVTFEVKALRALRVRSRPATISLINGRKVVHNEMSAENIVHEPNLSQFSLKIDDVEEVAFLKYRVIDKDGNTVYDLFHTYVPQQMRGRGIAAKMVNHACSFARENNYKIIPSCSYIPVYMKRNPTETDVLLGN